MRFWIFITALLLFTAGGTAGFVVSRACSRGGPPGPRMPFFPGDPESSLQLLRREDVYRELAMSEAQKNRIDALLTENREKVREIHKALAVLGSELRSGVEQILTSEQRARLGEIKSRIDENELQERVTREVRRLREELTLSAEQEERIRPVLVDYAHAKSACFKGSEGKNSWSQVQEKLKPLAEERYNRLAAILSPEQLAKYKELKERERPWDRRRR
jgi:Spy/CpxP family protein refolding chaperone